MPLHPLPEMYTAGISIEPIFQHTTIDRVDITILQFRLSRNAMYHLRIHRDTKAVGKAIVIEKGWNGTLVTNKRFRDPVQLNRRYARPDGFRHLGKVLATSKELCLISSISSSVL